MNSSNGYNTRGQELVDAIIANNFRYLKDMSAVTSDDATYRKPLDMSARIVAPCFNSNVIAGWEGDQFGAVNPKENAEHFNRNYNTWQTLTDLPNGVYAVACKGFYRAGEAQEAYDHFKAKDRTLRRARIYASSGGTTLTFPLVSPFSKSVTAQRNVGREIAATSGTRSYYIPDDMISAEHYMHALDTYDNLVFADVQDHTLTIGVSKGEMTGVDWCMFDDFRLTYYGDQPGAYRQWLTEMRKHKVSYSGVTVSKPYYNAYNTAFNTTGSDRETAIAAMQAIDQAWEELALNAELWAQYKAVAAEAQQMLQSNYYSAESKAFLQAYLTSVYQKRLSALQLTNDELPAAIEELRAYMELMSTGEWTGIDEVQKSPIPSQKTDFYTLDGRPVSGPLLRGGIVVQKGRKVLRRQ